MNDTVLLNQQHVSPLVRPQLRTDTLEVHSIFYTIQGEGPLSGHPAIFVRLAGCNLQCPQCDTAYTGPGVRRMTPSGVLQEVQRLHAGPRLVVITGGEPLRQPYALGLLTVELADADYEVQIETNGALPMPEQVAPGTWVVVSPKTNRVHPTVVQAAVAYKYVLSAGDADPEDGLPRTALGHPASPRIARPPEDFPVGAIYVSPADDAFQQVQSQRQHANAANTAAAVKTCMKHGYTLCLQIHKTIGME